MLEFKIKKSTEQLIVESQDAVIKAYEKVEIDLKKEIQIKDEIIAAQDSMINSLKEVIELAQSPFFRRFGLFGF
jgi:hypothetical protein